MWGPSSPRCQTLPSPQLVEFKMSEREVPITIAQHVVIKFLTNEKVGPIEIWRRLHTQYRESTLSKTQVKFWHKEFRWRKRCRAKTRLSAGKVTVTVFWDFKGVLLVDFLHTRRTVNAAYYPLSYGVPVRERYGSTLLPATREQHDQNCTQSH